MHDLWLTSRVENGRVHFNCIRDLVTSCLHGYRGVITDALAVEFVRIYRYHEKDNSFSAEFTVSAHEEIGAKRLCQAWCHKAQFYFVQWVEIGGFQADFHFADALIDAYQEPPALTEFFADVAALKPATVRRIASIRRLRPGIP